jgi:peroxiredoxin
MGMMKAFYVVLMAVGCRPSGRLLSLPHSFKGGRHCAGFRPASTKGGRAKLSEFRGKSCGGVLPGGFYRRLHKEMLAYQASLAKFQRLTAQVFGISGDNTLSQSEFAKQLKLEFPLLGDFASREVMAAYGVLRPGRGIANRATFVVDKDGKIAHMRAARPSTSVAQRWLAADWRTGRSSRLSSAFWFVPVRRRAGCGLNCGNETAIKLTD